MSVIYKSLKQVRKEEQERKRRPRPISPEAVAPSYQRVLKRFAGYIILAVVFLWVTMFWLQSEVRRIVAVTAEQVEATTVVRRAAQEQPAQEAQGAIVEQAVVVSEVRPIQRMTPIVERRPAPPPPPAPATGPARIPAPAPREPVELVSPNLELERHFSAQALRNNELLSLEQSAALRNQPPAELAMEMQHRLGAQSMYGLRLGGYEALKAGEFALAEDYFRQSLERNPRDKATRMNLVLALLGQEKRQEARHIHDRLAGDFPMDEQVAKLGQGL